MLISVFAAVLAAATPQETAAMSAKLTALCEVNLKDAARKPPKGFCGCFGSKAGGEAAGLKAEDQSVFLILTETAGEPGAAQKLSETRLKMDVKRFAGIWERVNPIGQKAGEACLKASPAP
jgi:hypothetical protein